MARLGAPKLGGVRYPNFLSILSGFLSLPQTYGLSKFSRTKTAFIRRLLGGHDRQDGSKGFAAEFWYVTRPNSRIADRQEVIGVAEDRHVQITGGRVDAAVFWLDCRLRFGNQVQDVPVSREVGIFVLAEELASDVKPVMRMAPVFSKTSL